MGSIEGSATAFTRRRWFGFGIAAALGTSLKTASIQSQSVQQTCAPVIPTNRESSNGGSCPYPIPWLDKNGNHNQPAGPNVELSNIYHFKGKLARCSGFHGGGSDNQGNRREWGTSTTDYSYMAGEYWASRQPHQGIFAHT